MTLIDWSIFDHQIVKHLANLAVAYVLALPIGWNREHRERSAGLRTFPLVAIAACGFVEGSEELLRNHPEGQARLIEGVITGMGFIGGGAILKHGDAVKGTATAASLWATGAIGLATGFGVYHVAIALAVVAFFTMYLKPND